MKTKRKQITSGKMNIWALTGTSVASDARHP